MLVPFFKTSKSCMYIYDKIQVITETFIKEGLDFISRRFGSIWLNFYHLLDNHSVTNMIYVHELCILCMPSGTKIGNKLLTLYYMQSFFGNLK
jgi:hypothetical protein